MGQATTGSQNATGGRAMAQPATHTKREATTRQTLPRAAGCVKRIVGAAGRWLWHYKHTQLHTGAGMRGRNPLQVLRAFPEHAHLKDQLPGGGRDHGIMLVGGVRKELYSLVLHSGSAGIDAEYPENPAGCGGFLRALRRSLRPTRGTKPFRTSASWRARCAALCRTAITFATMTTGSGAIWTISPGATSEGCQAQRGGGPRGSRSAGRLSTRRSRLAVTGSARRRSSG